MKNGILHRYEEPIIIGEYVVKLIRKTPGATVFHTDKGIRSFKITQSEYTEGELHELLLDKLNQNGKL